MRPKGGRLSSNGITGSCEPPYVDPGSRTPVLWESSAPFSSWAISSAPAFYTLTEITESYFFRGIDLMRRTALLYTLACLAPWKSDWFLHWPLHLISCVSWEKRHEEEHSSIHELLKKNKFSISQKGCRDLPGLPALHVYEVGRRDMRRRESSMAASPIGWCWRRVGNVEASVPTSPPSLSVWALVAWISFKLEMIRMDTLGTTWIKSCLICSPELWCILKTLSLPHCTG